MTNSIISCQNLKKTYTDADGLEAVPVLHGINFEVKLGESIAIIGRSGSGKTTLVNLLGGLELPSEGKVFLHNRDISELTDSERGYHRNRILGFIFQFHHLLAEFTALENIGMPLLIRGVPVKEIREKAEYFLDKVGLSHRGGHKPNKLSGGEKQRVAIARALVCEPKCILADEPTGNLDQDNADQVYDLMMNLLEQIGTSLVVVTHDTQLANRMDRIVKLDKGTLVSIDSAKSIKSA